MRHDRHRGRRRPARAHPHPAVARRSGRTRRGEGHWTGQLDVAVAGMVIEL
ncbi:hypothetical protein [Nocardioides sp. B-3]|uniref:hypothetical protein n=1 Tax=Nocardioides sp. B-3 TaxID=2895565 RepID=UPI002152F4BC|nr:hypothetical protein [Nocardioides sp. B-3]UUZ60084.1 hypothetical protein LP418_03645 [Nocardioides sp. B-3]